MTRKMAGLLEEAAGTERGGGDIRSAFRQAVAEHTPGRAAGTEPIEAAEGDEADEESDPTEGDEGEDAAAAETGEDEAAEESTEETDEEPELSALDSEESFKALQRKHANDPVALRKALVADYTKKTQAVSEQRRRFDIARPIITLLESFEDDPAQVIREFGELAGLNVSIEGEATRPTAGSRRETAVSERTEDVIAELKTDLGEDLAYLADKLGPAIAKLVDRRLNTAAEPMRREAESVRERLANDETDRTMAALETRYPDWKEHEAAMTALSLEIAPARGQTMESYVEKLYKLASRDAWDADRENQIKKAADERTKKRIGKITTAARDQARARTAPASQVVKRPTHSPSFAEAAAAAMRGERFEDDED